MLREHRSTDKVWDLEEKKEIMSVPGQWGTCYSIALSRDGKRLFAAGVDRGNNIKVWDIDQGKEIQSLHGHTGPVRSLALSGDGRMLFSGSLDGTIKVWEVDAGVELSTLCEDVSPLGIRRPDSPSELLAPSRDGKRLCSANLVGSEIKVWEVDARK
jgi:WD40 repeat protein